MLVAFRQGIVRKQASPRLLNFNGNTVDLNANTEPVILALADGITDYLFTEVESVEQAWRGPFAQRTSYWLYWDIDTVTGQRTFGSTPVEPRFGLELPQIPKTQEHFFNTATKQMMVFNGKTWDRKLRVFAGEINQGKLISYDIGPQTDVYQQRDIGEILYDGNDEPIIRNNGKFLTTEISIESFDNPGNQYKLEATKVRARSLENIPAFHGVAWVAPNRVGVAEQVNPRKGACVGISTFDILRDDINSFVTKGFVINEAWDFSAEPGSQLFLGPNGEVTTDVPSRISSQFIGKVISRNIAYIDIKTQIIIDGPIVTPTVTPTIPAPTVTPTISLTPAVTATPSYTPEATPTNTVTPEVTPTNTVTPEVTPTNTVTPAATTTPPVTPTPSPTEAPQIKLNNYVYNATFTSAEAGGFLRDIKFKPDGTKMFINGNSRIGAYDLATPWDLSTASYSGEFVSTASLFTINISSDGTKLLALTTGDDLVDGTLSTPWDISTLTFSGNVFDPLIPSSQDVFVRPDDPTKVYIFGSTDGYIEQRTLGTAWDVSTTGGIDASADLEVIGPIFADAPFFSEDGLHLYFKKSNALLGRFALSVAWDLNTLSYDAIEEVDLTAGSSPVGTFVSGTFYYNIRDLALTGRIYTSEDNTSNVVEFIPVT